MSSLGDRVSAGVHLLFILTFVGFLAWGAVSGRSSKDPTKPRTWPTKELPPPPHAPRVDGRTYFVVEEFPDEDMFFFWARYHCRLDCPELAKEKFRKEAKE